MPGSRVTLDISSDPEEFSKEYEKTFRSIAKLANIPGFRRGKAPRHIVENMVGHDVIVAETHREMMDGLYQEALEQESLKPIAEPVVDIITDEPLEFRVLVEVFPTVTLGDYESVRVEPREVELEDGEVEEALEQIQKNFAEWIEADQERTPADGDQVTIDLTVWEGEEHFQNPAEDAVFVLGESDLFETLVEAIKMMPVGSQSEVTLAFEEDDTTIRPELRGKTLRYDITLKTIKRRDIQEIDEEFIARVGEFESVDEFYDEVRKDVLRAKALEARNEVMEQIIEDIVAVSEVEVPKTMIESEIDDEITQLRTRMAQQGIELENFLRSSNQTLEDLRTETAENAERKVRNTLILQEISEAQNIEVTPEDIEAEISSLVVDMPDPVQARQLYQSEYFAGMLQNELHDRKLTAYLVDLATDGVGAISGAGAELLAADEQASSVTADEEEDSVSDEQPESVTEESVEMAESDSADIDAEDTDEDAEIELTEEVGLVEEETDESDQNDDADNDEKAEEESDQSEEVESTS